MSSVRKKSVLAPSKNLTLERYQDSERMISKFNLSMNVEPTSVLQQVKDYFISREIFDEFYIQRECSKKISRERLSAYFKKPIKKHELEKYKEIYKTECVNDLTTFSSTNQIGGGFWDSWAGSLLTSEKVFNLSSHYDKATWIPKLELFLNIISTAASYMIPWSYYLIAYPNGRKLVTDLFQRPGLSSVINLYCVIYNVQTNKSFDNLFFREELIRFLPYVNIPSSITKVLGMGFEFSQRYNPLSSFVQPTQEVLANWYQYISVHLVSSESLRSRVRIMDPVLVNVFLTNLASKLEKFIEQKGGMDTLTDTLTNISALALDKSTRLYDSVKASRIAQSLLEDTTISRRKLSSPRVSSPRAGSPRVSSPRVGSPRVGSPRVSSPSVRVGSVKQSSKPTSRRVSSGSLKSTREIDQVLMAKSPIFL